MHQITRREALHVIGVGAVASAALPSAVLGQGPAFPKGAIIRTLFKDFAPEELGGGASLFHEHMSLAPDFNDKFRAATLAAREANGLPPAAPGGGGRATPPAAAGGAGAGRAAGPPPAPPGLLLAALLSERDPEVTDRHAIGFDARVLEDVELCSVPS